MDDDRYGRATPTMKRNELKQRESAAQSQPAVSCAAAADDNDDEATRLDPSWEGGGWQSLG